MQNHSFFPHYKDFVKRFYIDASIYLIHRKLYLTKLFVKYFSLIRETFLKNSNIYIALILYLDEIKNIRYPYKIKILTDNGYFSSIYCLFYHPQYSSAYLFQSK